jgi:thioredoxin reductase
MSDNGRTKESSEGERGASGAPFDVAIVGGGPAGLSASIWLARYLHRVLLVDSGDPRNWETRGINGFLGQPGIRPVELRGMGRDEARQLGVELVDAMCETVTKIDDDCFELVLATGEVRRARRLLLAIGLKDVWPDIPGLEQIYGANAHVCPDCDGHECRDKKVVVIGHGRKAVGMALNLTTWTREIIICTNGEAADFDLAEYCEKLDALNIPVIQAPITCIKLDTDKIFLAVEQYPADDLGAQLRCDRDAGGHIIVDDAYHTSVLNCYAAGDIVPGPQLAIAAAGDGAIASLAIHRSLVPDARKLEKLEMAEY